MYWAGVIRHIILFSGVSRFRQRVLLCTIIWFIDSLLMRNCYKYVFHFIYFLPRLPCALASPRRSLCGGSCDVWIIVCLVDFSLFVSGFGEHCRVIFMRAFRTRTFRWDISIIWVFIISAAYRKSQTIDRYARRKEIMLTDSLCVGMMIR